MAVSSRLVEIWAADDAGKGACGSGWAVGERGVLTARHVVEPYLAVVRRHRTFVGGDDQQETTAVCQVRLATSSVGQSGWVDCKAVWDDDKLDIALLEIVGRLPAGWCRADTPGGIAAELGEADLEAEAIGFPELTVKPDGTRQPEQPPGVLQPAGAARDERGWTPFDIDSSHPENAALWQGLSGGAVRERVSGPDARLVGVVVAANPKHQQRRLYAVALDDISKRPGFLAAAKSVGWSGVVESRLAPLWRSIIPDRALAPQGVPRVVSTVTDLGIFGVKAAVAEDAGGSLYPPYLPRSADSALDEALDEAADGGRRLVLVSGHSASGKSRSAAEALRRHPRLGTYRLVVPFAPGGLSKLVESGVALSETVVWVDDIDVHLGGDSPDLIRTVVGRWSTAVFVATIRTEQLQSTADRVLQGRVVEMLTDQALVRRVRLSSRLDDEERARAHNQFSNSRLLNAVDRGVGLGEWLIAGPKLIAYYDDEDELGRPLADTVIGWYRAGLQRPLSPEVARSLWRTALDPATQEELGDSDDEEAAEERFYRKAEEWACHPVMVRGAHEQAIIGRRKGGFTANDYVVDHVSRDVNRRPIPDPIWVQALEFARQRTNTGDLDTLYSVGVAAQREGAISYGIAAMRMLADRGDADGMFGLGFLLERRGEPGDLAEAERQWRAAARVGHTDAWYNLGVLREWRAGPEDLAEAERYYRYAAVRRHTDAMFRLAVLLERRGGPADLADAERHYRDAAELGNTEAMHNLGLLLVQRWGPGDLDEAERRWRAAAEQGHAEAGFKLAVLLDERGGPGDLDEAERRWRGAADQGHATAAFRLGLLLHARGGPGDLEEAERHWRAAAEQGHTEGAFLLGLLLHARGGPADLNEAERRWRGAAEEGHTEAAFSLGVLYERRGEPEDLAEAERRYGQAAIRHHPNAIFNLAVLLHRRGGPEDLAQAELHYRSAAELGDTDAMLRLGVLLGMRGESGAAEGWWVQAVQNGSLDAAVQLAVVRAVAGDLERARLLLEGAQDAGLEIAGDYLAMLDPRTGPGEPARQRLEHTAEGEDTDAINYLGAAALLRGDATTARAAFNRSAKLGDLIAPLILRALAEDRSTSRHSGIPGQP